MSHAPADAHITVVESDESKWWAGTRYDVRFLPADSGWSTGPAATYVMDISDEEETSPGSASPWSGWVGWFDDEIIVTWTNPEVGTHGVARIPEAAGIDDEPTTEQWEFLARLVVTTCFDSSEADE